MNSKKIQTLAAALLSFLLILYVGYQLYQRSHKAILTETAMYGTVSDTIQADGFAIREETVITDTYQGVLSYRVADGARVPNNGVIADVFSSESDAAAQNQVESLDREIESLQALSRPADFFSANPATLNSQIFTAMEMISAEIGNNNFSEISALKENLQTILNRKRLVTGEDSAEDYQLRVQELERERDAIAQGAGAAIGTIQAPRAGYFISSTDGFENVVGMDELESITPERVKDLLGRERGTGLTSSVGKICADFSWYLVCVFPEDVMWRFEDVTRVNLDIPFASPETIPATIAYQNRDPLTGETAVVFECTYMDSDIASVRAETIQVNVRTYSGVLVNEKALRFEDVATVEELEDGSQVETVHQNVKGVYVQNGRTLEFVQVFTEKTVNGYAICKTELDAGEREQLVTDHTIQLYDNVVVEGTDLYDGKTVQ